MFGVFGLGNGKSECRRPAKKLGESQGDRKDESGPSFCNDGSIIRSDRENGGTGGRDDELLSALTEGKLDIGVKSGVDIAVGLPELSAAT